ncbi:MAG TPA: MATE family efflux transporter [Gemmatimonadales bacterium]|nr:MATE family efflux transporter [Gemmatimonadales bacterium]
MTQPATLQPSPAPRPAPEARPLARALGLAREALRGTRQDYTEGPITRALVLLAVPMVLETLLESLFAVVDIFFVAHLGADAIATVGLTESMMSLIYAVAIGLGIGAAAVVARRIGEHDPSRASHAGGQAILLGVLVSVPISVVGLTLAPDLLRVLGASAGVRGSGSGYARVLLGGNAAVLLLFLINAVFRGAGDAAIAMRSLWIASGCNMILGPLFIFGVGPFPRLGVTGAAVGTTIGRSIGVLYQIRQLARRRGRIAIRGGDFFPDVRALAGLLRLSGSGILQVLIGTASWLALVRVLAGFGSQVLAGYTIGIRVIVFALLPSWGLSNAAATMVGQNLGAKKPDRAARAVWTAAWYNMWVLGAVGFAFVLLARPIIGIFTRDAAIVPWGVGCLRIVSAGFVFYAYGMVVSNAFNGAGDTWTPTVLNLVCFWLLEVPLAWALSRLPGFGPDGVFAAIALAFSILALASALLFRRGRWKTRAV